MPSQTMQEREQDRRIAVLEQKLQAIQDSSISNTSRISALETEVTDINARLIEANVTPSNVGYWVFPDIRLTGVPLWNVQVPAELTLGWEGETEGVVSVELDDTGEKSVIPPNSTIAVNVLGTGRHKITAYIGEEKVSSSYFLGV